MRYIFGTLVLTSIYYLKRLDDKFNFIINHGNKENILPDVDLIKRYTGDISHKFNTLDDITTLSDNINKKNALVNGVFSKDTLDGIKIQRKIDNKYPTTMADINNYFTQSIHLNRTRLDIQEGFYF